MKPYLSNISKLLCLFSVWCACASVTQAQTGPGAPDETYTSGQTFSIIETITGNRGIAPDGMVNGYLVSPVKDGYEFYDISDPFNAVKVGQKASTGNMALTLTYALNHSLTVPGRSVVAIAGAKKGFEIWDWSNIGSPQRLVHESMNITPVSSSTGGNHNFSWQGKYLYFFAQFEGLYVFDVSDLSNPVQLKFINRSSFNMGRLGPCHSIGNLLVVGGQITEGIATFDISDPANPIHLDTFKNGFKPYDLAVRDNLVFVATAESSEGVAVYDISNPSNIQFVAHKSLTTGNGGRAEMLAIQDEFIHVAQSNISGNTFYRKLNASNLSNMTIIDEMNQSEMAGDNKPLFLLPLGNVMAFGNVTADFPGKMVPHATAKDTTAPRVTMVHPVDNATNVATTSRIGVNFSDGINMSTVNTSTYIIRPIGGSALPGIYSYGRRTVNFCPDDELLPGTEYEVVVTAGGIEDSVGNAVSSQFISRFTTEGGVITGPNYPAEDVNFTSSGATTTLVNDAAAQGGQWIKLNADGANDSIEFTLPNVSAGNYMLRVRYKSLSSRGIFQAEQAGNGTDIGGPVDQYAASSSYETVDVGTVNYTSAGDKTIRFFVTGKNGSSSNFSLSFDTIILEPAAPDPGAELFSDDFNDGNDNGWTRVSGTWSVNGSAYRTSNGGAISVNGDSGWTDYAVEAKVVKNSRTPALLGRYVNSTNFYNLEVGDFNGNGLHLWKNVNGNFTEIGTFLTGISNGTPYTLKMEFEGNTIRAYLDGVLRITVTDNAHASGRVGFRASGGSGNADFDDIVVNALGGAPGIPAAPSGLTTTVISSSQINLSWTDNSNVETGFKIERRTGTGSFSQIATVGANVTSYNDTGLSASTEYGYRVRANNAAGDSAYSNISTKTTQAGQALTVVVRNNDPAVSGSSVDFDVVTATGEGTLEFSWEFGDGSAQTAFSTNSQASHTYSAPGHYTVIVRVRDASSNVVLDIATQTIHAALTASKPSSSSTIIYDATRDRAWNVNPDNDTVTCISGTSFTKLFEQSVGDGPRTLAQAPDGTIWVVNENSADISILNPDTGALVTTIGLPYASSPYGIALAPDGSAMYVSLQGTGELAKLNPTNRTLSGILPIGPRARGIAVSANSQRVFVTRFVSPQDRGEVTEVNGPSFTVTRVIAIQEDTTSSDSDRGGRGVPNYMNAIAISPDGGRAWIGAKKDNVRRGQFLDGQALDFDNTVRNIISQIDLSTHAEDFSARVDLDNTAMAMALQFSPFGDYVFIANMGTNEIQIQDVYSPLTEGLPQIDLASGLAPHGLTLSGDSKTLFVHNFTTRNVEAYDVDAAIRFSQFDQIALLADVSTVANETLSSQVLLGKQIFHNAGDTRMSRDGYLACVSCHSDGGQDGRVWDFTDRGEGLRNTTDLRGRSGMGHGPVHWTGNFDEIQDFENDIRGAFGGTGLMTDAAFNTGTRSQPLGDSKAGVSSDLDALAAYVASLTEVPDSPERNSNGTATAAALAGRGHFEAANCQSCHGGSGYTDSTLGLWHDVGTIKPSSGQRLGALLTGLDTPTLRGVWKTAPYLHDGSAATLEDVFNTTNAPNGTAHAAYRSLTASQQAELIAFLEQLDENEPAIATGGVTTLVASADAYVRSGVHANTNYGTAVDLRVKDSNNPDFDRRSYIQFDLSTQTAAVTSAVLKLYLADDAGASAYTVQIRESNNDSWTENGITWNNQPGLGTVLGTTGSIPEGTIVSFDVTDFVNQQIAGDSVVSFAMAFAAQYDVGLVKFASRETANAPVLELTGGGSGPGIPAAPTGLTAVATSTTTVDVDWVDNSNVEDNYVLEIKEGSGSFQLIDDQIGANTTAATVTALTADTNYTFRVKARNVAGDSAYSNEASVTTDANPGGTLLSDDFNDGNDTGWTRVSGTWSVSAGKYNQTSASGQAISVVGDTAWTDYIVEAKVNLLTGNEAGLLARYTNSTNFYQTVIMTNGLHLWKNVGGSWTEIGTYSATLSRGTEYTIAMEMDGSNIRVLLDGVERIAVTDSAHSSGRVGFKTYQATAAFDDLTVTTLGGGTGSALIEVGQVNWTQSSGWLTVNLAQSFNNPIVIAGGLTANGGDPSTVRVRNVAANTFELQVDEWDYLDGQHGADEVINYLVLESGVQTIGGLTFDAGVVSDVTDTFKTKTFAGSFSSSPTLLTQTVTVNEASAVVTRIRNLTSSNFEVRVQEEEAADGTHAAETVHYVAVSAGSGSEGTLKFRAGNTGDTLTHAFSNIAFGENYPNPFFIVSGLTFDGGDPSGIRYQNLGDTSVEVKVEEEASSDSEVSHTTESLGWLVFGDN